MSLITAAVAAYAKLTGSMTTTSPNGHQKAINTTKMNTKKIEKQQKKTPNHNSYFKMPLHYPRHSKADYETMPEWKLDLLLAEYGLPIIGDIDDKRKFAMGAFLWASQLNHH